ncbi:MAG: glycosyltransferase family 39 protein [Planctomycetes bacterium]|nr:glycosyltransferase family 39 protein [Planctomycetota bacterium]
MTTRPLDIASHLATDHEPLGRMRRALVVAVLVLAALLRIVALDTHPLPYHQDELSDIYDGYSIATTGADRAGQRFPILARGMGPGGFTPALNLYICAITSSIGGLSVWVMRMPAVIGGLASVWLVFLLARRLMGSTGGILAMAFVAFSPIHILYSRQLHMGVFLQPLYTVLILYLLDRCLVAARSPSSYRAGLMGVGVLGFAIGSSSFTYVSCRITAPLLALVALVWIVIAYRAQGKPWRHLLQTTAILVGSVVIGASPTIYSAIAMPDRFFARGGHLIPSLGQGVEWWAKWLGRNLADNLDPNYLFFSFGEHYQLSIARLGVAALPFLYIGMVSIVVGSIVRRDPRLAIIPIGMAIALVPGVICRGNPSPMRTSGVWVLYPIICAYGTIVVGRWIDRMLRSVFVGLGSVNADRAGGLVRRRVAIATVTTAIALCGLGYAVRYAQRPDLQRIDSQYFFVEIGRWLRDHGHEYERVYIDRRGLFGYLYIAAFSGMTPVEYQQTPREGYVSPVGWDYVERLGRYHFKSSEQAQTDWIKAGQKRPWLVIRSLEDMTELLPRNEITASRR